MKPLYFGCLGSDGHYVFDVNGVKDHKSEEADFLMKNDGRLAPKNDKSHGKTAFYQFEKFSILAMHDYSIDSRPGSNSMFLIPGTNTKEETTRLIKIHFPKIWERINSF